MNRDEILAKSREENKNHDEMMLDILKKAGEASSQIGLAVAAICIYFSIEASKNLVMYAKLKEKKQLLMGLLMSVVGIALFVANLITLK